MQHTEIDSEVAIVGAGPVGLTLAMLLRSHGISVRVFEAHDGLSRHPKARGIAASSMETFRGLGMEAAVRSVSLPAEHVRFFRGASLVDPDAELTSGAAGEGSPNTPSPGALCSQDRLEPVLAAAAREAGADIRFGARVTAVSETADAVDLRVAQGQWAGLYRANYVVGCDGPRSLVRDEAGIELRGEQDLSRFLSIRFRAPLGDAVRGREATSYFISEGKGGFLAIDNDTQWIYQYPVGPVTDISALRADGAEQVRLVRDAAGIPALSVAIEDTMLWRMDACVAETFRVGRLLIAGDAAHQTPPTGGHGMNVGIADALTLAWQLAAVVRGRADDALLDRYSAERRPVASAVVERSLDNSGKAYGIDDELLLTSGYSPAPPLLLQGYAPAGDVGRRLPHVPVSADGAVSSVDLGWGQTRVVVGADAQAWRARVAELEGSGALSAPVRIVVIRGDAANGSAAADPEEGLSALFAEVAGVREGDALLVRPDGHIAARYSVGTQERGDWLRGAVGQMLTGGESL